MKRLIAALSFAVMAQSAFAGLTYKVESASSGFREGTLTGTAEVDGKNFRLNVTKGDGAVFPDSAFVVSHDGGRTMTVVDPTAKTYYELSIEQITGGVGAMLRQAGDTVKFSITNPKVAVRDLGAGEKIEGYPTQHKTMDTAYDMNLDVMGQKLTLSMLVSTESWNTDQIPLESASFLQTGALHTGFDEIDKLIAAQSKAMNGFPLKQVSAIHVIQNGTPMDVKTTTTVSAIEKKTIAPAEFTIPSGFTKTDNPIEKMMKAMKQ